MPSRPSEDRELTVEARRVIANKVPSKNGKPPEISELGRRLRAISDKALASGVRALSREEIRSALLETRGGSAQ